MTGRNKKPKRSKPMAVSIAEQLCRLRALVGVSERLPESGKVGDNEVDDRDEITRQLEANAAKWERQLSTRLTVDDLRILAELEDAVRPIIDKFTRDCDENPLG